MFFHFFHTHKKYISKHSSHILEGFLVFLIIVLVISTISIFLRDFKRNKIVKDVDTIQFPAIPGQPIKWVKIVKASSRNNAEHLLKLPETANNIKISRVNSFQSTQPVFYKPTDDDRIKLAQASTQRINSKESFALAQSLKSEPKPNLFSETKNFLLADVGKALDSVIKAESKDKKVSKKKPVPKSILIDLKKKTANSISDNSSDDWEPVEDLNSSSDDWSSIETEEDVIVEYETPAPIIAEVDTDTGKIVQISAAEVATDTVAPEQITNVLAFTTIPEIYKVGQEHKIKIKWQNEGDQEMEFHAYDLNGNGKLDYVEWTVPHLSTQTFEIIFISKAFLLNSDLEIEEDIYDIVQAQDNDFATVNDGKYVRVTFEQILNNGRDITVYGKASSVGSSASIEVYPVYADGNGNMTQGSKLNLVSDGQNPDFSNISENGKYRVLLSNLDTPTDIFDLKVVNLAQGPSLRNAGVEFDYIVDPTITFSGTAYQNDEVTGVGSGINVALRINGGTPSTTTTGADSTFSFSGLSVSAGDTLTVYFYGASDTSAGTYTGNFVTITDGNSISGISIFDDHVVVQSDNGATAITIADLADYDNDNNSANLLFTANTGSPNTLTVEAGNELFIPTGEPFTPGGDTTVNSGGLDLNGTWTETGTETLTIAGNFDSTGGTFTAASGTVKFYNTTLTVTGSQTFNNLEFSSVGPSSAYTYTISSGTILTVNGTLTISGVKATNINTGDIYAKGNIDIPSTGNQNGTAIITINGTGDQIVTGNSSGGVLPSVNINKASGDLTLSSTISVYYNWTYTSMGTGTLITTGSTVKFVRTNTITGSHTLNNVTFSGFYPSATLATDTVLTVNGTLTIGSTTSYALNGNSGSGIHAKGDIVLLSDSYTGSGTAIITINGTGDQTITGSGTINRGPLPSVVINKASGNLTLSGLISVYTNWTYTSMGTGTLITTGSTVAFTGSPTITGSHTLNNVTFYSSWYNTHTVASGTTLTVDGTLTISGLHNSSINTGNIHAKGDIVVNGTNTSTGGNATITVNGTGNQVFTGSGTAGQDRLPNVVINKSSGTLTLASITSVAGTWTYTAGTVDATTNDSTVAFYGNTNLDGQGTSATMAFDNVTIAASVTLAGNLDVDGNLTIDSSKTLNTSASNYSVNVAGNWTNSGTFTSNSSTVTFDGSGNSTIITGGTGTTQDFQTLTINKSGSGVAQLSTNGLDVDGTLTVTAGTLDLNALNLTTTTTCSITGTLKLTGDETLSCTPTLNSGSTVEYSATSSTRDIKNWTYHHLKINGSGGTFTLPSAKSVTNLNHTAGTLGLGAYNLNVSGNWAGGGNTVTGAGAVVLDGTSQAISGSTTFSNLTKSVASADTLTFTAGTTQTITGTLTLNGASDQLLSLRSSATPTQWSIDPQGTRTISYLDVKDSNNTNATAISTFGLNITDSTGNTNWNFNTAPNAPTLVSPANASYTNDDTPILSANYSDSDPADVGTTNYRISSGTAQNCLDNANIVASGASSETADNDEDTTYTPSSSIGADGTYYWCAQNNDGTTTSSWASMGNFVLDTVEPTTSDDFANNNTWVNSNQTITLTPTDDNSGIASTKYCADTDNTCVVASGTAYTVPVTISDEGTTYFRYSSTDNAGNVQTTVSRTVKIDKTIPVITVSGSNPVSINTGSAYVDAGATATDAREGDVTASITTINSVNANVAGTYYVYYDVDDSAGNSALQKSRTVNVVTPPSSGSLIRTIPSSNISINGPSNTNKREVNLTFSASGYTATATARQAIILSTNPDFSPSVTISYSQNAIFDLCQNDNVCPDGAYTVYAKFINAQGLASPAVSKTIILDTTSLIAKVTDTVKNAGEKASDIISAILPIAKPKTITFPPIESSVPKVAQDALSHKWQIVNISQINDFVFADLPSSVKNIIKKFPEVGLALEKVGINNMNTATQLTNIKISLPGLSEAVGLSVSPSADGLAVTDLSAKQKEKIPTGVVFARTVDEKIDLNVKLSIGNKGLAIQTLNTIQGQTLKLVLKPEETAEKVEGYLIFKSDSTAKNKSSLALTASVIDTLSKDLVLTKFEYKESTDGIWTAEVASPLVLGKYELRTVVDYKKENKDSKEISMIVVVDPEGYVYEKSNGKETRLNNAVVSIYWLNPETESYELWPAKDFRQQNPQKTDVTGRYAFLVPVGKYYLEAKAGGYNNFKSESFLVEENKGVFINIEMKARWSLLSMISLQNMLLGGILIFLAGIFVILIRKKRQT